MKLFEKYNQDSPYDRIIVSGIYVVLYNILDHFLAYGEIAKKWIHGDTKFVHTGIQSGPLIMNEYSALAYYCACIADRKSPRNEDVDVYKHGYQRIVELKAKGWWGWWHWVHKSFVLFFHCCGTSIYLRFGGKVAHPEVHALAVLTMYFYDKGWINTLNARYLMPWKMVTKNKKNDDVHKAFHIVLTRAKLYEA